MDISRLHSNATQAARSRNGVGIGRDSSPTAMSSTADALFRTVLDGIVDSAMIDYGKGKGPARGRGVEVGKWSFTKACAKVDAELRKEADKTPGVGHYDPSHPAGTRTYKIGGLPSKKGAKKPSASPLGPGHYVVNEKPITKHSPSPVKMSQPTISRKKPEEPIPGPGTYSEPPAACGAAATMGTAPRILKPRSSTPGPGNYEQRGEKPKGGKWRKPGRSKSKKTPDEGVPGPGAYVVEDRGPLKEVVNGWGSAVTGRLTRSRDTSPGPGHYVAEADPGTSGTGYQFGTSIKEVAKSLHKSDKPGPGSYAPVEESRIKGEYSMAPHKPPKRDASPGPGAYDLRLDASQQLATIGTERRSTKISEKPDSATPGPGAYDTTEGHSELKSGHVFGTAPKEAKKRTKSPGPGTYDVQGPQDHSAAPIIGTAKKIESIAKKTDAPGPGAYDANEPLAAQTFTMPTAPTGRHKVALAATPGPGAYDYTAEAEKPTTSLPWNGPLASRGLLDTDLMALSSMPGPGAYDVEMEKTIPTATIGKAATGRDSVHQSETPGPGSYSVVPEPLAAGIVIGTAVRTQEQSAEGPGPGAYDAHMESDAPAAVFSKTGRVVPQNDNPGPGHYETRAPTDDVQGVTFGTSIAHDAFIAGTEIPGPGAYDTQLGDEGPAYSFGRQTNSTGCSEVPGPGAYKHDAILLTQGAVIGTELRTRKVVTDTPGPGAYYQEPKPEGGFTMQGRLHDKAEDGPGPGCYDVRESVSGPAVVIGTAMRKPKETEDVPGPGAYAMQEEQGKSILIGDRIAERLPTGAPGPGQYDVRVAESIEGFVMGTARRDEQRDTDVPGPGAYNLASSVDVPGGVMGERIYPKSASDVPGPGAYTDAATHATQVAVIGTSVRVLHDVTEGPGPGAYDEGPQHTAPAASVTGRPVEISQADIPGPGHYNAPGLDMGPAFTTGTAPREGMQVQSDAPGPGAYSLTEPYQQGPAYTMGKRLIQSGENNVPGPGAYDAAERKLDAAAVFGTARRVDDVENVIPGPGAYEAPGLPAGPAATVTSGRAEPRLDDVPGPGHYSLDANDTQTAAVICKAPRSVEKHSDVPGPGAYELEQSRDEKLYTMFGRPTDVKGDEVPGPGSYAAVPIPDGSAVAFSKAARDDFQKPRDVPGPGAYTEPPKPHLQGGFIGKSGRGNEGEEDVPGPGAYELTVAKGGEGIVMGTEVRSGLWGASDTPGPGAYYDVTEVRASGGAVFGSAAQGTVVGNNMPGPGAYDVVVRDTKIDHIIGTAIRGAGEVRDTPGPGAYDREEERGSRVVISKTGRSAVKADEVPGPGAYCAPTENGKGVLIGMRHGDGVFEPHNKNVPGPGSYDVREDHTGPMLTMLQRVSEPVPLGVPGPGAYAVEQKEDGPKISIGRLVNEPTLLSADNPGPGHYCVVEETGRAVTIAGHTDTLQGAAVPGPGAYNPRAVESEKAKGVTILGKVPELKMPADPGPGAYNLPSGSKGPEHVMAAKGKGLFDPQPDIITQPGPGTYNTTTQLGRDTPSFTMAEKLAELNIDQIEMPGPGHYHNDHGAMGKPLGHHTVTLKTDGRREAPAETQPGPGSYHREAKPGVDAPKVSFYGRDKTHVVQPGGVPPVEKDGTIPGPGAYHRELKPGEDAPKVSIYGHADGKVGRPGVGRPGGDPSIPGPGTYHREAKTGEGAPKVSIYGKESGKVGRPGGDTSIPGPGAYKLPPQGNARAASMGRPPRPKKKGKGASLGPGSYYKAVPMGTDGPRCAMGSRGKEPQPDSGLPFYDVKPPKGPSVTIGMRREPPKPDLTPGPAEYRAVPLEMKKAGIGFAQMTERREGRVAEDTPGPGTY